MCVCVCVGRDKLKTIEMLEQQQLSSLITQLYCCLLGLSLFCFMCVCDGDLKDVEHVECLESRLP